MIPKHPRPSQVTAGLGVLVLAALASVVACSKRGPRDLRGRDAQSELGESRARDASADGPERVVAPPTPTGRKPREIAKANSRALATDATHVYFGDGDDDTLCSVEKMPAEGASNEPVRIARRAPIASALALDSHEAALAWIGTPGDVVLRVPVRGGAPTTVRDRAIFTDVAASGGDVFVTEARGSGGSLTRVTKSTAAQLATFEGTPRGIVVDADNVYVETSSRLLSSPRTRGELSELARGSAFASPHIDDGWLYATTTHPTERRRIIVRVRKTGGALETVATNVRDASIAAHHGVLYWFDADRPALLSSPIGADTPGRPHPAPRVVSEDPILDRVNALVVDDDGAFVATGHGEAARILVISLR